MTDLYTNLLSAENSAKAKLGWAKGKDRTGKFSKNADRFERKHEWLWALLSGVILGVAIWGSLL